MSSITWIVIILILVSILVTVTEVGLRFAMLERSKSQPGEDRTTVAALHAGTNKHAPAPPPQLRIGSPPTPEGQQKEAAMMPSPLEELARTLGLEANATLDEVKSSIRTLQDGAVPLPVPEGMQVDELK